MYILNIFENPFLLLIVAFAVTISVWVLRILRPEKSTWRQSLIPLSIVVIAFGLDYLFKTDNEKIQNAVKTSKKAFVAQQIGPITEVISEDYSDAAHSSKTLILAYCQALFEVAPVKKVSMLSKNVNIQGQTADFTAEAVIRFDEKSEIAQMGKSVMLVKFRLHFKKTPDKSWLVNSSDILEIDRKPLNWSYIKNI